MKRACFDSEWKFRTTFIPPDVPIHIQEVTDEQYELLSTGRAKWEPGVGIVLLDSKVYQQYVAEHVAVRFIKRDHHAFDGSTPLRNRIHDLEDVQMEVGSILPNMLRLSSIKDGDEFEVCITPTGRRPHGDRWFLFPHHRPETDEEVLRRIEGNGNKE